MLKFIKFISPLFLFFIFILSYFYFSDANTKVVTYTRGNKSITFIGMCHIGSENYYNDVNNLLDGYEEDNHTVIYEMVKSRYEDDINYEVNTDTSYHYKTIYTICDVADLKAQNNYIKIKPDWVWGDMYNEDLEVMKGGSIIETPDSNIEMNDELSTLKENKSFLKPFIKIAMNYAVTVGHYFTTDDPIILDMRNSKLIMKTFETLENTNNVVIIYGEAHRSGVEDFLYDIGFDKESSSKLDIFKE